MGMLLALPPRVDVNVGVICDNLCKGLALLLWFNDNDYDCEKCVF